MKNILLIISILIPMFSFLSTLLMTYADRHKVPTNPFSGLNRAMKTLNINSYNPSQDHSDYIMEMNNKKMNRIYILGIICLILSFILSIVFVVIQQIDSFPLLHNLINDLFKF